MGGWMGRGGLRLRSILSFWGDLGLIILVSVFPRSLFGALFRFLFAFCVLCFFFLFFSGLSL